MIFNKIANNVFKEVEYKDSNTKFHWEQVPDEDLWEDGELSFKEVDKKILENVHITGDWILVRRINNG